MCILCVEFQKGKLNIQEARKALTELTSEKNMSSEDFWHYIELFESQDLEKQLEKYKEK